MSLSFRMKTLYSSELGLGPPIVAKVWRTERVIPPKGISAWRHERSIIVGMVTDGDENRDFWQLTVKNKVNRLLEVSFKTSQQKNCFVVCESSTEEFTKTAYLQPSGISNVASADSEMYKQSHIPKWARLTRKQSVVSLVSEINTHIANPFRLQFQSCN